MQFRLGSESRLHVIPPNQLRASAPQFNEKECCSYARPDHRQLCPRVISEQLKRVNCAENHRDPFGHDTKEEFDTRINCRERNENSEVKRGRSGKSRDVPGTGNRQHNRRREKENQIKREVSTLANETFHFTAKNKQHVHFHRQPKKPGWTMHKRVASNTPELQHVP